MTVEERIEELEDLISKEQDALYKKQLQAEQDELIAHNGIIDKSTGEVVSITPST